MTYFEDDGSPTPESQTFWCEKKKIYLPPFGKFRSLGLRRPNQDLPSEIR
jgi:hypothetical protein